MAFKGYLKGRTALPETLASVVLIPFIKEALEKKERNLYEKIHGKVDSISF